MNFPGKHILFLADTSNAHTRRWVTKALNWGYQVTVCSMSDATIPGATVVHWRRRIKLPAKLDYFFFYFQLRSLLRGNPFDLVHAHYASSYGLLGALASPKKFIVSVWGSDILIFPRRSTLHRLLLTYVLKKAQVVCATSKVMADEVMRLASKQAILTPFGVDTNDYKPTAVQRGQRGFVIGTVKRLETVYGIDTLLRAFAILKSRITKPVHLKIAGRGSQKSELEKLAHDLGIQDDVIFLGGVEQTQIPALLNSFDVYVALSNSESFGVAVLEASSCSLPVVTTNVGGLPEVVRDDETGLMVSPNEPAEAANAIQRILESPELAERFGEAGRRFVKENFEWDQISLIMKDLYASQLATVQGEPSVKAAVG